MIKKIPFQNALWIGLIPLFAFAKVISISSHFFEEEQNFLAPLPFLLSSWLNPIALVVLSLLAIFLTSYLVYLITSWHIINIVRSVFVPLFLGTVLLFLFGNLTLFSLIASCFFLAGIFKLLELNNEQQKKDTVFLIGLSMGMGLLFSPIFLGIILTTLLLLLIVFHLNFKRICQYLSGILIPTFFLFTFLLWAEKTEVLSTYITSFAHLKFIPIYLADLNTELLFFSILTLLIFFILLTYYTTASITKESERKMISSFWSYWILLAIYLPFSPTLEAVYCFLYIPLALLLSYAFTHSPPNTSRLFAILVQLAIICLFSYSCYNVIV